MAMNKNIFLLLLLSSITCLYSCKKDASIVGTWSATTMHKVITETGRVVLDTTYTSAQGSNTVSFTAAGGYDFISYGSSIGSGSYSLGGNNIVLLDAHTGNVLRETIASISDHALVMLRTDTIYVNPLWTTQYTFSYSR